MQFVDELDVIEAKMSYLIWHERYIALTHQRQVMDADILEAKDNLEDARIQYLQSILKSRLN